MTRFLRPLATLTLSALVFAVASHPARAVNIAIVDTGIDPAVLGPVLEPGGFDFYNNDDDPSDDSTNQHGTSVGHLAFVSGSPVTLTAIKAFDENTTSTTGILDEAFSYVAGLNTPIVVHANGSNTTTTPQVLVNVANSGKIVVVAAGNNATANPTGDAQRVAAMGGRGIVAGALAGGNIAGFSARAGNMAEHYLLADSNSLISSSVGTSMAAPRIAGAAASVMAQSPFLSPQEVVSILLETATDLGAPGTDPVYGRGALNVQAALNPVGQGEVPTEPDGGEEGGGEEGGGSSSGGGSSGSSGAGGAVIALAALGLGGAWAAGVFDEEEELKKTILTDKYGRAFNFDFTGRLSARDTRPSVFSMLHSGRSPLDIVQLQNGAPGTTFAFVRTPPKLSADWVPGEEEDDPLVSMVHNFQSAGRQYTMGLNSGLADRFGALSFLNDRNSGLASHRFTASDVFTTPVLGYSSSGTSFKMGWNDSLGSEGLGFSVIDDQEEHGQQSNSLLYERAVEKDHYRTGFQVGALMEDSSLLGGSSGGLFGTDQTNTYYLGVNAAYRVASNVTLMGSYFHGLSDVDASQRSALDSFSSLRSEGFGLAVVINRVFTERGSWGFAWSSPMQTTAGSARLTLPVGQEASGAIRYSHTDLSFDTAERENIFETYFQYRLTRNDDLFAHLSYTDNPISDFSLARDRTLFMGWKHRF